MDAVVAVMDDDLGRGGRAGDPHGRALGVGLAAVIGERPALALALDVPAADAVGNDMQRLRAARAGQKPRVDAVVGLDGAVEPVAAGLRCDGRGGMQASDRSADGHEIGIGTWSWIGLMTSYAFSPARNTREMCGSRNSTVAGFSA